MSNRTKRCLILGLLSTSEETSSSGSNKTDLLTRNSVSGDGRGLTNVLMVTTTMGMVDGIHGNTTSSGPRVSLDLVLVEGSASLKEGLVNTTTTGNNTNDTTGVGRNNLLGTRGKLQSSLALISIVANNDNVVTRGSAEGTTVTRLLLNVGEDGTLRNRAQRKNVTNVKGGLSTGVDELASVDTLIGNEGLLTELVLVRVAEDNLGKRSTSTRVVNNLLNDTADVALTLNVVELSELSSTLS